MASDDERLATLLATVGLSPLRSIFAEEELTLDLLESMARDDEFLSSMAELGIAESDALTLQRALQRTDGADALDADGRGGARDGAIVSPPLRFLSGDGGPPATSTLLDAGAWLAASSPSSSSSISITSACWYFLRRMCSRDSSCTNSQ